MKIEHLYTSSSKLDSLPIKNGRLIVLTDKPALCYDMNNKRYNLDDYILEQIAEAVKSVYRFKGSVDTVDELPKSDQVIGDVWNVRYDNQNYAWDGSNWDPIGINEVATDERYGVIKLEDNEFGNTKIRKLVLPIDGDDVDLSFMLSGILQSYIDPEATFTEKLTNPDTFEGWTKFNMGEDQPYYIQSDGKISTIIPANNTDTPNWNPQLKCNDIELTNGKYYTISGKVAIRSMEAGFSKRKFQLLLQSDGNEGRPGDWSILNGNTAFEVNVGEEVTFETTVKAENIVNPYLFGLMMGHIEGDPDFVGSATVELSSFTLKEYDRSPYVEIDTLKEYIDRYVDDNKDITIYESINDTTKLSNKLYLVKQQIGEQIAFEEFDFSKSYSAGQVVHVTQPVGDYGLISDFSKPRIINKYAYGCYNQTGILFNVVFKGYLNSLSNVVVTDNSTSIGFYSWQGGQSAVISPVFVDSYTLEQNPEDSFYGLQEPYSVYGPSEVYIKLSQDYNPSDIVPVGEFMDEPSPVPVYGYDFKDKDNQTYGSLIKRDEVYKDVTLVGTNTNISSENTYINSSKIAALGNGATENTQVNGSTINVVATNTANVKGIAKLNLTSDAAAEIAAPTVIAGTGASTTNINGSTINEVATDTANVQGINKLNLISTKSVEIASPDVIVGRGDSTTNMNGATINAIATNTANVKGVSRLNLGSDNTVEVTSSSLILGKAGTTTTVNGNTMTVNPYAVFTEGATFNKGVTFNSGVTFNGSQSITVTPSTTFKGTVNFNGYTQVNGTLYAPKVSASELISVGTTASSNMKGSKQVVIGEGNRTESGSVRGLVVGEYNTYTGIDNLVVGLGNTDNKDAKGQIVGGTFNDASNTSDDLVVLGNGYYDDTGKLINQNALTVNRAGTLTIFNNSENEPANLYSMLGWRSKDYPSPFDGGPAYYVEIPEGAKTIITYKIGPNWVYKGPSRIVFYSSDFNEIGSGYPGSSAIGIPSGARFVSTSDTSNQWSDTWSYLQFWFDEIQYRPTNNVELSDSDLKLPSITSNRTLIQCTVTRERYLIAKLPFNGEAKITVRNLTTGDNQPVHISNTYPFVFLGPAPEGGGLKLGRIGIANDPLNQHATGVYEYDYDIMYLNAAQTIRYPFVEGETDTIYIYSPVLESTSAQLHVGDVIEIEYEDIEHSSISLRNEVTQIKEDLQSKPSDVQVNGTSIVTDGIANIPAVEYKNKVAVGAYGLAYPASEYRVDNRYNNDFNRANTVNLGILDHAVKSALSASIGAASTVDGKSYYPAWTEQEQADARARLGAASDSEVVSIKEDLAKRVRSVNNTLPDENGNVNVEGGSSNGYSIQFVDALPEVGEANIIYNVSADQGVVPVFGQLITTSLYNAYVFNNNDVYYLLTLASIGADGDGYIESISDANMLYSWDKDTSIEGFKWTLVGSNMSLADVKTYIGNKRVYATNYIIYGTSDILWLNYQWYEVKDNQINSPTDTHRKGETVVPTRFNSYCYKDEEFVTINLSDYGILLEPIRDEIDTLKVGLQSKITLDDIPKASGTTLGLVKNYYNTFSSGISFYTDGSIKLYESDETSLKLRANTYAITNKNYDLAVKTAMCDEVGAAWTTDEQANARARLGIHVCTQAEYDALIDKSGLHIIVEE